MDNVGMSGNGMSAMNISMSSGMQNQTMQQERSGAFQFCSFMEERNVPIYTNLEPFYPKDKQTFDQNGRSNARMTQVVMTLDHTAQDITKELKKKMRVLDRNSFSNTGMSRSSMGRGQRMEGRRTLGHGSSNTM